MALPSKKELVFFVYATKIRYAYMLSQSSVDYSSVVGLLDADILRRKK